MVHETFMANFCAAEEHARQEGANDVAEAIANDREQLRRLYEDLSGRRQAHGGALRPVMPVLVAYRLRGAARQSRPAPTRRRGSRRGSTSTRGSPSDDPGDPEPPSRGRGAAQGHRVGSPLSSGGAV
jgi:hypothetical protein